jgi:alkylation response protein AidB-like acyl-CoA dehydrogenase
MDWNLPYLNDEQKSLVMLMKEFCDREVDIRALNEFGDKPMSVTSTRDDVMARMPWDLISKAHDAGLRQLAIPTEYGGGGYGSDHLALAACAEAAGYYGGQFARLISIPWKHTCTLISSPYVSQQVKDEIFTHFMQNRKAYFASSASEANHGTDITLPYDEPGATGMLFARREGDDWILNGDKQWCEGACISSYVLLTVRTEPTGPISKSATQFAFPTSTPGWSIRVNDMMGNEIVPNSQQHFENCRVPDRLRITPVGEGLFIHRSRMAFLALYHHGFIGWAQRVWEDIRDYAKTRVQGGRPIIQHNNVGMLVAEGDALLRTARLFNYQYSWECSQPEELNPLSFYYGTWYIKKVLLRIMEIGLDVYGGMAPQKELTFEHWIRVHLSLLHGGSTGTMGLVKAAKLLEKG